MLKRGSGCADPETVYCFAAVSPNISVTVGDSFGLWPSVQRCDAL